MSYNTRRGANYGGVPSGQQSVGNIGQRRPAVTNNFVSGGQLTAQNKPGTPQNKPGVQVSNQPQRVPHQTPQQAQNTNTTVNYRTSQNQGYQQQQVQQQQVPQQQVQQQQQPSTPQVKAEPQTPKPIMQGVNPPNPALESANGDAMDVSTDETVKKKPFWSKTGNKISKKEKMRRWNVRLSKSLQPKNAVMILNELVKNTSYMVDEIPVKTDSNQFKASVLVDGIEHIGLGRSKIHAKNSAAETALKYLIKSNKLTEMKKDEEGNEKMDVTEDETQPPLPWQHVASFALFKLFTSWGEDPNAVKTNKTSGQTLLNASGSEAGSEKPHENKPAKKMPENPETINPLMLINQMLPHAQFEEIGKSGNPPNVTYSFRCNVDGHSFIGTGPNKKAAKKLAAFGACHKILNVTYPTEVYVPIF